MNAKHLTLLATLLLLVFALSGCKGGKGGTRNPLNPVDPVDEVDSKNHDDPQRIELILFDCHFHGNKTHATSEILEAKYLRAEQRMVLEQVPGKGMQISKEGVDRFVVFGGTEGEPMEAVDPRGRNWTDSTFVAEKDANLAERSYGLLIKMYNKERKEITGQFATNGEDRRHQFFFRAEHIRPTKYGDPSLKGNYPDGDYHYMYYYYFDTDPWDKSMHDGGKYTGISNPIGLKGLMQFLVPDTGFDLHLTLLHARSSKYDKEGHTSPFYDRSKKQKATDVTDIDIPGIPFVVFARADEYLESDEEDLDKLSNADRRLVDKLADAFGITPKEALHELWLQVNGAREPENSPTKRWL